MRNVIILLTVFFAFSSSAQDAWSFTFPDNNTVKVSDLSLLPNKIDTNFVKGHLNPSVFVEMDRPKTMNLVGFEKMKEKNVYRLKIMIMPKDPSTEDVLNWKNYRYYILTVSREGRSYVEYVGMEI
jgi:hypothetical protein